MRKVIFQYWIHALPINKEISTFQKKNNSPISVPGGISIESVYDNIQEGTHQWSDFKSGYFHGWGFDSHEDMGSLVMDSVALVEDVTSGVIYKVEPTKMRFVLPPEKEHSSDTVLEIKAPKVGGNYEIQKYLYDCITGNIQICKNEILDVLKEINAKLKSI